MLGHREPTFDDYLEILQRRYWILLLTAILGCAGAYLYSRTRPNEYQSRTLVLVQQPKVNQNFVTPVVSEQVNQRLESMQEQILSSAELQPVVKQFHIYEKQFPGSSPAARAGMLRNAISVTPVQPIVGSPWAGIPAFTVQVTLNDPTVAQQVCAKITSMFLDANTRWSSQAAQDTTAFLSQQIDDAKQSLDDQDAKLTAFKLRYLGKLPDQAQTNMNVLAAFNSQLEAVTEGLHRTQQDKVYLESQLSQQLAAWKATRSGTNQLTLQQQLSDLRSKLITMRTRYTNDYPDVVKLKNQIADLQEQVNAANAANAADASPQTSSDTPAYAEPPQIQQLRRQIQQYDDTIRADTKQQTSLQQKIEEYQARVQMSPVVDQQFTELTRNYQTALEFYRGLLTKKAQADMGADLVRRQQAEDFRVVEPASFSGSPSAPNRALFAGVGGVGGLGLGLALVLWLELRDKLIRTERDVEFYLQVPTIALVPLVERERGGQKKYLPSGLTGEGHTAVKTLDG